MKTTHSYINNVPINQGELTVIVADTADDMLYHSSKLATDTFALGLGVVLINCGITRTRFNEYTEHITKCTESSYYATKKYIPRLVGYTSEVGNLVNDEYAFRSLRAHAKASVFIIVGWEWSSDSYLRKDKLMFMLRKLIDEGSTIIVYTQTRTKPIPGKMDRGGIGKLATLARSVTSIDAVVASHKSAPAENPTVATEEEMDKVEKEIQSIMNNINGLGENPQKKLEGANRNPLNDDKPETFRDRAAEKSEKEPEEVPRYPLNDDDRSTFQDGPQDGLEEALC
ncbi:MAG TPA: hypothetical protein VIX80_04635 [Candidatus Kapabacteria bacterium]